LPHGRIDADATDYIKEYARQQSLNKVKIHVILVVMKQQASARRREPGNWGVLSCRSPPADIQITRSIPLDCTKSIQIKSTHDAWRTKIMLPAKVPILTARQGGLLVTCVTVAPLRVNV
jgi:hypothetical protein